MKKNASERLRLRTAIEYNGKRGSPANIHSTIGPLLIRGGNDIYKKRESQLLETLFLKKVAMTYSPTKLQASVAREAGSSMVAAVSHA